MNQDIKDLLNIIKTIKQEQEDTNDLLLDYIAKNEEQIETITKLTKLEKEMNERRFTCLRNKYYRSR